MKFKKIVNAIIYVAATLLKTKDKDKKIYSNCIDKISKQAQAGDILAIYGNSWVSKLITKFSGGASHVVFMINNLNFAEATGDYYVKDGTIRLKGQTQISDISHYCTSHTKKIVLYRPKYVTPDRLIKAMHWIDENLGKQYAFAQLFIDLILYKLKLYSWGKWADIENAFVCSEFVGNILKSMDYEVQRDIPTAILSPHHIETSKDVEKIAEFKIDRFC